MRILSIILITLFVGSNCLTAADQPKVNVVKQIKSQADQYHSTKMYYAAIPFYTKLLEIQKDSMSAWKLADCFWNLRYYDSAVVYIRMSGFNNYASNERLAEYYYWKGDSNTAISYIENALKYADAKEKLYLKNKKEAVANRSLFLKDSLDWSVGYLSFNTSASEYAPSLSNGALYFLSNRAQNIMAPKISMSDGLPYDELYKAGKIEDLNLKNPILVKPSPIHFTSRNLIDLIPSTTNDNNFLQSGSRKLLNSPSGEMFNKVLTSVVFKGQVGSVSMSMDGREIFFSRISRRKINGMFQLEICKVIKYGKKWSAPTILSFNDSLSSSFHPFYDEKNRTLYFSSDRNGGQGGADIYQSILSQDGIWSSPVNLGPAVNTIKNEGFPTVSGTRLYFSSNGWPGLGGVDIFYYDLRGAGSTSKNLGFPINSNSDDYSIAILNSGVAGFFSSNRYGTDDVFAFQFSEKYVNVKSTVFNKETGLRQSNVRVVLEQEDTSGSWQALGSYVTNYKGIYEFKVRPNRSNYRFRIMVPGKTGSEQFQYFNTDSVTYSIELDPFGVITNDSTQISKN